MWTIFKVFTEFTAILFMLWFFGPEAYGVLAPCGIKFAPPALEVQSLNHWNSREVPQINFIYCFKLVCFKVVSYVAVSNWDSLFKENIKL